MRKQACAALVGLVLAADPAPALEPGDLVVGAGSDLYAVGAETGALERLSEGPDQGMITDIAVRTDGVVFLAQVVPTQSPLLPPTASIWRFDPETAERSELVARGPAGARQAIAIDGSDLVVPISIPSRLPPSQLDLLWIDSETGDVTRVLPLPHTLLGISDVALDRDGRILLSTSRSGIVRADPRTGEVELVSLSRGSAIAVEGDGSILLAQCCLIPIPPALVPQSGGAYSERGAAYVEPDLDPFPLPRPVPGVLRIDPDTGGAETVSMGNLLGNLTGIAVEAEGGIVVSSRAVIFFGFDPGSVVRVEPGDGTQTLVVGDLPDASAIAVVPPPVAVDVLPSGINVGPRGKRTLPVVLLGSQHVDVADVDVASLAFGPDGASPVASRVVRRGRDAFPDLLLFFRAEESGLLPGDQEACLAGMVSVFRFEACDDVVVRGRSRS
jgi:hypothetical protein